VPWLGLAAIDQVLPFHDSIRVREMPPPLT
jgi:hypothetical protein